MLETDALNMTVQSIGAVENVTVSHGSLIEDVQFIGNQNFVNVNQYYGTGTWVTGGGGLIQDFEHVVVLPSGNSSSVSGSFFNSYAANLIYLLFSLLAVGTIIGFFIYRLFKCRQEYGRASITLDYKNHPIAYVVMPFLVTLICRLSNVALNATSRNIHAPSLIESIVYALLIAGAMAIIIKAPKNRVAHVVACFGLCVLLPFLGDLRYILPSLDIYLENDPIYIIVSFVVFLTIGIASIMYIKNKGNLLIKILCLACALMQTALIIYTIVTSYEYDKLFTNLISGTNDVTYFCKQVLMVLQVSFYYGILLLYIRKSSNDNNDDYDDYDDYYDDYDKKPSRRNTGRRVL